MSLQTVFSGILSSDSYGFLWETIGWIKHTFLGVIGHMNEGGVGDSILRYMGLTVAESL
ncbi:MAG: hypothetical protein JHC69_04910 [Akkermansiaceae bacterium]|nr:hypothetical protein [Akkermansiaceae bacterium]